MNDQDRYVLIQESSAEEGFSSSTHITQVLSDEIRPFPVTAEYFIPDRYFEDTLTLMPVNLDTVFVYWEITPELYSKYPYESNHLKTKIIALEEEKEIAEFSVHSDLGDYYVHVDTPMKHLQARMGFYDNGNVFVVILTSNVFTMPNDSIELSNTEIWMNIDENTRAILLSSMEQTIPSLSSHDLLRREK